MDRETLKQITPKYGQGEECELDAIYAAQRVSNDDEYMTKTHVRI